MALFHAANRERLRFALLAYSTEPANTDLHHLLLVIADLLSRALNHLDALHEHLESIDADRLAKRKRKEENA